MKQNTKQCYSREIRNFSETKEKRKINVLNLKVRKFVQTSRALSTKVKSMKNNKLHISSKVRRENIHMGVLF